MKPAPSNAYRLEVTVACRTGVVVIDWIGTHRDMTSATRGADMELRIIKNDERHRRYLEEARRLARGDPGPESDDGARLELLAKLVDDCERARFKFRDPFAQAASHAFDGARASREAPHSDRAPDPRARRRIPGAPARGQAGSMTGRARA